jgi:hypothetical protein
MSKSYLRRGNDVAKTGNFYPVIHWDAAKHWFEVQRDITEPTVLLTQISAQTEMLDYIKSQFQAAVINDTTGDIVYYLDKDDPTKKADGSAANLDGTDGSVFIIKPGFWIKTTRIGDIDNYTISPHQIPGARYSPKFAYAKYKGHRPSSGPHAGKLVSWSGVDITTSHDNRGRLYDFRADARLGRDNNWTITPYHMYRDLMIMYITDMRNLNAQDALGYVSRASSADWNNYNGYFPVWQTGHMNDQTTFFSGSKAISIPNFVGGTSPLNTEVVSYMGIEDLYGHIWEWLDGISINYTAAPNGLIYICENPSHFADGTATNYTLVGATPSAGPGYVREVRPGEIIPSVTGGTGSGSTTFFCDYHWSSTGNGWRAALVGGSLLDGARSGPFFLSFGDSAAFRNANFGARLGLYLENTL